jgi:hypothetical protein
MQRERELESKRGEEEREREREREERERERRARERERERRARAREREREKSERDVSCVIASHAIARERVWVSLYVFERCMFVRDRARERDTCMFVHVCM